MVSVTEGRHCGQLENLSEKKTDKNEVINNADNNAEWTLLKRFLHDRSKIIYQQKPYLGKNEEMLWWRVEGREGRVVTGLKYFF